MLPWALTEDDWGTDIGDRISPKDSDCCTAGGCSSVIRTYYSCQVVANSELVASELSAHAAGIAKPGSRC